MRHLSVIAVCALLLAGLLVPGVAQATGTLSPLHDAAAAGPLRPAAVSASGLCGRSAQFVSIDRILSGSGTISMNVYRETGTAEAGASTAWLVLTADDYGYGEGTTDASGHVDMTGVPAASGNGEIAITPASGDRFYDISGWSWPAAGTSLGVQPGWLDLTITRSSDDYWDYWDTASVDLNAVESSYQTEAASDLTGTGSLVTGHAAAVALGSATLDTGSIYYWVNEGAELNVAGTSFSPGMNAGSLSTNEADAHALWMNGWGSGKPGTTTWLVFERYPSGWQNEVTAVAGWPATAATRSLGTWTSAADLPDPNYQGKKVTIPSGAAVGYAYYYMAQHTSGPLYLYTWFQTCSLNASRTTVSPGGSVRLSGVVPTQGHQGSKAGKRKSGVVLYKRTKSAGQPGAWNATLSGWTKVATVTANGYGKYSFPLQHPKRSTWYVVRYPSDDWYYGSFTSVRKVTVK